MVIDYAKGNGPSNQMEFTGLGQSGQEIMDKAEQWVDANEDAFDRYLRLARLQCRSSKDGKASPNSCKEWMRTGLDVNESFGGHGALTFNPMRCVSVPNALAPALARIAMGRDKTLDFRLAASKVDGFSEIRF